MLQWVLEAVCIAPVVLKYLSLLIYFFSGFAARHQVFTSREYFMGSSRWWNRFDVLLTAVSRFHLKSG